MNYKKHIAVNINKIDNYKRGLCQYVDRHKQ